MTYQIMFKVTLFENRIIDEKDRTTGIPKYGINVFTFKAFNEDFGAGHFHGFICSLGKIGVEP